MSRLAILMLLVLVAALPLQAQEQLPDYRISVISTAASDSQDEITVTFGVINIGGAAVQEATAILTVATSGVQLGITPVPALETNETQVVEFTFPATTFPGGSVQSLQASVGIDEVEPRNAATIGNNTARVGINVPPRAEGADESTPEAGAPADSGGGAASGTTFTIPGTQIVVDLTNPLHIGLIGLVLGITLVLLWVITIILRLLFQKTPQLNAWTPPYALLQMLDPNSVAGRRQLWQPHAQNDAVIGACAEGTFHIRKLLLGTDGVNLSGWRITAMRLSQYDMYGRVARSHTLAPNGVVKRLNRAAHQRTIPDETKALRQMRPVAGSMIKRFEKKLNKKNAMLPVALDIRLRGTHGEVQIVFELFGCGAGEWQIVDKWEPDMIVMNGAILENFTYTLFGQRPGEQYKAFRQRMESELAMLLAGMMTRQQAAAPAPQPQVVQTPPVEQWVPQDTAPIPPVGT